MKQTYLDVFREVCTNAHVPVPVFTRNCYCNEAPLQS